MTQTATRRKATTKRNQGIRPVTDSHETMDALRRRARTLFETNFDCIPNETFETPGIEEEILPQTGPVETKAASNLPRDLPAHLARLCEAPLLTAEEERDLFRRMNYVKFRAEALRTNLHLADPNREEVELCEKFASEAKASRDRIVSSNMRLVISVVKKFVTPQNSFDELLSDGIGTLINAVDKFDYDRGFRFSTYAYRSIARNAYRSIADRQKENNRFTSSEDGAIEIADEGSTASLDEKTWHTLREMLAAMMHKLDRRERFIIRGRFALGAHRKVRTFQCLADKLGVSKERVRQLEQRAVTKLRNMAAEHRLAQ
jgi:RNA polymerase primary sigma factor